MDSSQFRKLYIFAVRPLGDYLAAPLPHWTCYLNPSCTEPHQFMPELTFIIAGIYQYLGY